MNPLLRRLAAVLLSCVLLAGVSGCVADGEVSLSAVRRTLDVALPVGYQHVGTDRVDGDITYRFRSDDGVSFSVHAYTSPKGGAVPAWIWHLECDYLNQWVAWRYPDEMAQALAGVTYEGNPPSVTLHVSYDGKVSPTRGWNELVLAADPVAALANLVLPANLLLPERPAAETKVVFSQPTVKVVLDPDLTNGLPRNPYGGTPLTLTLLAQELRSDDGEAERTGADILGDLRVAYYEQLYSHLDTGVEDWPKLDAPVPVSFHGRELLTIETNGTVQGWGDAQHDIDAGTANLAEAVRTLGGTFSIDECQATWTIGSHTWTSKAPPIPLGDRTACGKPTFTRDGESQLVFSHIRPRSTDIERLLGVTLRFDEKTKTATAELSK